MSEQARSAVKTARLAFAQAIAATRAAEVATTSREHIQRFRRALHNEQDAGRAFLAALDVVDPACVQCGCTQFNACDPPCSWVSMAPPLCSTCFNEEIAL